ncbi:telomere repeats-binding bouquet formation protein 1 [Ornithorhynchus anatinus]|uniref:telomere repeats-binding bouquet formation protein 1 n=1 Tax=Ornithorhynchus anatinus TaxID=9258 RepID=UPI000454A173|nr:telomere repeats-binding bouquet formation protein 1 [Ornithorhynchus anatinus]
MQGKKMEDKSTELTCAKIDMDILLKCIKEQVNNPPAVKSALLSIISICQQNSSACTYFEDIGGLKLVRDLATSCVHSMLKEVALHTLLSLANSSVPCQQSLCTPELFDKIIRFVGDKNYSMNLQIVSVYVLLALVSKNKTGQVLLRETGCIFILQKLFRSTIAKSEIDFSSESFKKKHHLWHVICHTLGAAVNNPQNEENQKICCSILPHVKVLLEVCLKPEIVRPLCLFVGLTMAENSLTQEFFISIGGLDVLSDVLIKLTRESHQSISSAKLAVNVTNAINVCIADNSPGSVVLARHHVVPKLLTLLLLESLNSGEKTSVMLTLAYCTAACEENLHHLLQNNGLNFLIDSISDPCYEALGNIVFIVLYNCKIFAKKLLSHLVMYASEVSSKVEKIEKALDCLKKRRDSISKEQLKRKEEKEQGPETNSTDEDSLLKGNDREKDCQKQQYELGGWVHLPPASSLPGSQLESSGGNSKWAFSSEYEEIGSEHVFGYSAPAVENKALQPPKEGLPVTSAPGDDDGKHHGVERNSSSRSPCTCRQERTNQESLKKVQKKK